MDQDPNVRAYLEALGEGLWELKVLAGSLYKAIADRGPSSATATLFVRLMVPRLEKASNAWYRKKTLLRTPGGAHISRDLENLCLRGEGVFQQIKKEVYTPFDTIGKSEKIREIVLKEKWLELDDGGLLSISDDYERHFGKKLIDVVDSIGGQINDLWREYGDCFPEGKVLFEAGGQP